MKHRTTRGRRLAKSKVRGQGFYSMDNKIYERGNLMIASAGGGVLLGAAVMSIAFPLIASGAVMGAVAGGVVGAVVGSVNKSEN